VSAGIATSGGLNLPQSFGYEGANRLTTASESGGSWTQNYSYDKWGNRAVCPTCYIPNAYATPTALMRYNSINQWLGTGVSYDTAGNQTALPSRIFAYDAENRLVTSTQPGTGAISYVYDGDGRRVQKTVGSSTTTFVYDGTGQLTAEYGPSTTTGTEYLVADMLGSTRLVLDGTGAVKERIDYLPFGEEIPSSVGGRTTAAGYGSGMYPSNPDIESQKFTSKERDAETGLDYFGARYFSGAAGRFTSADPTFVTRQRVSDPQQWNLYSYTRNNPLKYFDPDGKELKLAIYNSSPLTRSEVARVADRIVGILHQTAGLKNVTYELHQGQPSGLTSAAYELLPTPHSHLLEIRQNREGGPAIPAGEGGHNWEMGGHSAVDASVIEGKAKDSTQLEVGLANVGTHELLHDRLGHVDSSTNVMNPSEEDPNWLFNPNLQLTPAQIQTLQKQYNRPGEVDTTPAPAVPQPSPQP
jgi:RHS repeat-associated protein